MGKGEINFKAIFGGVSLILIVLLIIFFATRTPKKSPPRRLIAYWNFEEKEGQKAYDAGRKIHHGKLGLTKKQDPSDPKRVKGKIGKALQFDGKDDFVLVPDSKRLRAKKRITIVGWIKVLGDSQGKGPPIWVPNFQYRKKIRLKIQKKPKHLKWGQVLVVLDSSFLIRQGKMQKDCQDIRFAGPDKITLLPYWIESGCNTKKTKIWVKVPLREVKRKKMIYLYYGNPEAENKSNFKKVMKVPPKKWWSYPFVKKKKKRKKTTFLPEAKRKIEDFKGMKGFILGKSNRIIVFGNTKEGGFYKWWKEVISPGGKRLKKKIIFKSKKKISLHDFATNPKRKTTVLGGSVLKGGDLEWYFRSFIKKKINFSGGPDAIRAVAVDSEGNIILGGYDSIPGDPQWRVRKISNFGRKLWDWTLNPSPEADAIVDIEVDSRDNIIVGGYEKSIGNDRWRIEKLSPEGELIFSLRYNISEYMDILNKIAIDSRDNILAVGYDFSPGDAEWRAIKLDPQGNRIWDFSFNPGPGFDELVGAGFDSNNNMIIGGYSQEKGKYVWHVIKFDPSGKEIWRWQFKKRKLGPLKGILVDSKNNIVLGGLDFSKPNGWLLLKISEREKVFAKRKISKIEEKKPKSLPLKETVVAKYGSYQVRANSREISITIGNNSISAPLEPFVWTHFAVTYNSKVMSLYINGKLVKNKRVIGTIPTNRNELLIGYNFNGLIDELRIYKTALSKKKIKKLYEKR